MMYVIDYIFKMMAKLKEKTKTVHVYYVLCCIWFVIVYICLHPCHICLNFSKQHGWDVYWSQKI